MQAGGELFCVLPIGCLVSGRMPNTSLRINPTRVRQERNTRADTALHRLSQSASSRVSGGPVLVSRTRVKNSLSCVPVWEPCGGRHSYRSDSLRHRRARAGSKQRGTGVEHRLQHRGSYPRRQHIRPRRPTCQSLRPRTVCRQLIWSVLRKVYAPPATVPTHTDEPPTGPIRRHHAGRSPQRPLLIGSA